MKQQTPDKKIRIFRTIVLVLFAAGLVAVTIWGIRWVGALRDPRNLALFQERIASLGIVGWFVLFVIQYVQIVIAFIPGGPIQVVAGALFGPWGGMITCLLGTVAATATVFAVVKRFGGRALHLFVEEQDVKKYRFLSDAKRLELLILVLFFIPGTPKDALTYLFALTPISLRRFLPLATLARIPAMLTSVLAGDSIAEGKWLRALLLFAGISAIAVGGYLLHKKVIEPHMKRS